ncbi:MAG TPA: DUF1580 domain-containing protein [Gemmataceae bacterium]|nr:DUF1580 domain-containing protein [Gemmataceae bacterium]
MIDIQTEPLISLSTACGLVPPGRSGRQTHLSTLLRWILKGSKGPGGRTIRLEAMRVGGRWMTSAAALQPFAEALTPRLDANDKTVPVPPPRTSGQRQRASDRAGAALEKLGI